MFTQYNQLVSFQSNAVRYVLRYQWNITKERSFLFLKSNHDEMELQGRIYLFILQDRFLPNTPWRDWLNIQMYPLWHLILISSQPCSLLLLVLYVYLPVKQQITILLSLVWPDHGWNPIDFLICLELCYHFYIERRRVAMT